MSNRIESVKYKVELEDSIPWQDFYGDGDDVAENDRLIEAGLLEYYWIRVVVTVHFGKGGEREYSDSLSGVAGLWDTDAHSTESRKYIRSEIRSVAGEAFAQAKKEANVREQSIREAKAELERQMDADNRL